MYCIVSGTIIVTIIFTYSCKQRNEGSIAGSSTQQQQCWAANPACPEKLVPCACNIYHQSVNSYGWTIRIPVGLANPQSSITSAITKNIESLQNARIRVGLGIKGVFLGRYKQYKLLRDFQFRYRLLSGAFWRSDYLSYQVRLTPSTAVHFVGPNHFEDRRTVISLVRGESSYYWLGTCSRPSGEHTSVCTIYDLPGLFKQCKLFK